MLQGGSTAIAVGAAASWVACVLVGLVRAAGGDVPEPIVLGCALVAAPVAFAAAVQTALAAWRGPTVVDFGRADAVPCNPGEAAFVRGKAQLRGLLGGAGYVYRHRLACPGLAWAAAGLAGVAVLSRDVEAAAGAWPVALALVAAFGALLFPARPYFYRESTGGGAVVSPPSAGYRLRRQARRAGVAGPAAAAVTPPAGLPEPGARAAGRET